MVGRLVLKKATEIESEEDTRLSSEEKLGETNDYEFIEKFYPVAKSDFDNENIGDYMAEKTEKELRKGNKSPMQRFKKDVSLLGSEPEDGILSDQTPEMTVLAEIHEGMKTMLEMRNQVAVLVERMNSFFDSQDNQAEVGEPMDAMAPEIEDVEPDLGDMPPIGEEEEVEYAEEEEELPFEEEEEEEVVEKSVPEKTTKPVKKSVEKPKVKIVKAQRPEGAQRTADANVDDNLFLDRLSKIGLVSKENFRIHQEE